MKTAEEIVRALAAIDMFQKATRDLSCPLCGHIVCEYYENNVRSDHLAHDDDCPYRMAVEWVKEEGKDQPEDFFCLAGHELKEAGDACEICASEPD